MAGAGSYKLISVCRRGGQEIESPYDRHRERITIRYSPKLNKKSAIPSIIANRCRLRRNHGGLSPETFSPSYSSVGRILNLYIHNQIVIKIGEEDTHNCTARNHSKPSTQPKVRSANVFAFSRSDSDWRALYTAIVKIVQRI